uniref:Uncharacterized protein n=1 Tax=Crocodylus porosus TaxID=8502 RepID=A0A7M4F3I7_CROPO
CGKIRTARTMQEDAWVIVEKCYIWVKKNLHMNKQVCSIPSKNMHNMIAGYVPSNETYSEGPVGGISIKQQEERREGERERERGGYQHNQASKYHKELCKSAVVLSLFPISTLIIALLEVSNYYFHQSLEMMLAMGAVERALYGKTECPLRKLEHMFINCLNHQTSGSRMKLLQNICMQKLGS